MTIDDAPPRQAARSPSRSAGDARRFREPLPKPLIAAAIAIWAAAAAADEAGVAPGDIAAGAPLAIEVRPHRIVDVDDPHRKADFIGGFRLTAADPTFGGLSGMVKTGDALLLVGDRGVWVALRTVPGPDGAIAGLGAARSGRLRDAAGLALVGGSADAEAVATRDDGALVVAFERGHRIVDYAVLGREAGREIAQAWMESLAYNGGIEALATAADGALIAIAEEPPHGTAADEISGWRIAPEGGDAARFRIARRDGFSPTGAAFGPDGALYLLERRYRWYSGLAIRIRRFPSAAVDALARGDEAQWLRGGDAVLELTGAAGIDNFEAIAATSDASGAVLLTLASDDNFSAAQNTLIAQFRLR